jgi:hypothetical protein
MVGGGANVDSNRLRHQSIWIVPQIGLEQCLHGRPHAVDDRTQIARLVFCWPPKLLERRQNRSTLGMAEHDDQPRSETRRSEFDAADLRRSYDVASNTNDEEVAESLIEHDLGRNARIGASEDDRNWLLTLGQLDATGLAQKNMRLARIRGEPEVSLSQPAECFGR